MLYIETEEKKIIDINFSRLADFSCFKLDLQSMFQCRPVVVMNREPGLKLFSSEYSLG